MKKVAVAQARYHPARREGWPSDGPFVARLMALDGVPPMRWQSELLDVALERDPETGRYAYQRVVVTCPRQQGKTALSRGVLGQRLIGTPGATVLGVHGMDRQGAFLTWERVCELFTTTALRSLVREVRRTTGTERLALVSQSTYRIAAPTVKAGHGLSIDLAYCDEAWGLKDDRLTQALDPARIARPDPQLWIVSTAGTAESVYLRRFVEQGRAGTPGVCYVEFSAAEGDDPDDPATWARCNPALGVTIRPEVLAAAHASMPPGEFARAHLNMWTVATETALPAAWWEAAADPSAVVPPVRGRVDIGVDVALDRSAAAVGISGRDARGRVVVEVVDHRGGTDWLPARLMELWKQWNPPRGVTLDVGGPAVTVRDELERVGIVVDALTGPAVAAACGGMYDDLRDHAVVHLAQEVLDVAAAAAVAKTSGDRWRYGRGQSSTDISPLYAVTLARHATVARPTYSPTLIRTAADARDTAS